jgi:VacB/RNase II family 3'-5' exoribonuclease
MPQRATRLVPEVREGAAAAPLEQAFAGIRREFEVSEEFPAQVLQAASEVAREPDLPDRDEREIPFLTIDPPGSMDLDQAMHIERAGEGFRIRYAIADVPAFVEPGGPIDQEVRKRGQTIYCPDTRVPLHPTEVSEDAASLLPDQDRPAYVWDLTIGADGQRQAATVYRAMVRSRRRYTYEEVQRLIDAGEGEETLSLLREVGRLRLERESARGGASLPMPEQEVHLDQDGGYRLRFRPMLPAEEWNAQISLLTGIAAAAIMLEGGIGILRTMPPAEQRDLDRFRRQVRALGVDWPRDLPYGDFLRSLDKEDPRHLAIVHDATSLFRGAAYTAFDGQPPEQPDQAAVAAPYAHVTAPLRRLVDRFALVVCEALVDGREVPRWAREALPLLPDLMKESDRRAKGVDRACTDAVEAAVLQDRVGEVFDAVVVDESGKNGHVLQVTEPAVSAPADGEAEVGDRVRAELVRADIVEHQVRFRVLEVVGGE